MYKQLIRAPLQQAMVLLCVAGLLRVGGWLTQTHPTWSWVFAAGLGAASLTLIAGRFRKPGLLAAGAVLGLATVLATAEQLDVSAPSAPATITALYALVLWRITLLALAHPLTTRLVGVLGLAGGYGPFGGRQAVERIVHWCCFSLVLLGLMGGAMVNSAPGAIPHAPWSVLGLSALFLWLAGERYGMRLHGYLLITIGVWGVLNLSAVVLWQGRAVVVGQDPWLGVVLSLCAVGTLVLAWWLGRMRSSAAHQENALERLYIIPLQVSAVVIAALAALHSLGLIVLHALSAPGWNGVLTLAISSMVLLVCVRTLAQPMLGIPGVLLAAMAIVWGHSAAIHGMLPVGLMPAGSAASDQWLVLALTSLMLAWVAVVLARYPRWYQLYGRALYQVAWLTYGWTIVGALALLTLTQPYTPWLFLVLIAGSFPLLRPFGNGVRIRGIAIVLLASLLIASLLGSHAPPRWELLAAFAWAYGLWFAGNLLLPRFNARVPHWAVAAETWPWFGLLILVVGLAVGLEDGMPLPVPLPIVAALLAGYLLLMLRNSGWPGFPWLAVLALTFAGTLFVITRHLNGLTQFHIDSVGAAAFETLLLANLLLVCVSLWRRFGLFLAARLRLQQSELQPALLAASYAICLPWLVALGLWDIALIVMPEIIANNKALAVTFGFLLSISYLHALRHWHSPAGAQLLVTSVFLTILAAWGALQSFHLPLILALWGLLTAVLSLCLIQVREGITFLLRNALTRWAIITPVIALCILLLIPHVSVAERLATLAVLGGSAVALGWQFRSRLWIKAAAIMIIVLMHGVWLLWIPLDNVTGLLPWYALQFAVITFALRYYDHAVQISASRKTTTHPLTLMHEVVVASAPWIGGLAICEWVGHGFLMVEQLMSTNQLPWTAGVWDNMAALSAALVLIALGIWEARRAQSPAWVHAVAFMVAATAVYCRLLWVGLTPVNVWDTVAIMTAAYGLFVLQRITLSKPILNLMMGLPLLALLTVPFQLGSTHAALTLLAAGTLYLLTRRATGMGIPMVLGLLAVNGCVYLWVPSVAQHYGLFQVYLIPAGLSVLLLLQLHRRELNPNVLNGVRLAVLCTLYAAAAVDVFIQEQLAVFALALMLSILGIVVGIGLRTRAFLYSGVIFLVLNVLGQLIQLYPEQRLGRALVLMGLGATITGLMIWFNIKRELIMERVRIFRADLESWD